MLNWLLDVHNNGVVSDTITPDNIPDGYGIKTPLENTQFLLGFAVGLGVAVGIYCLIKLCKYLFKKAFNSTEEESE